MKKKYIKKVISFIIGLFAYLFSPKSSAKLRIRLNQLYSIWYIKQFKYVGENFYVSYPFYLRGGECISIGKNFNCGLRLQLETYSNHLGHNFSPNIFIGDNVGINHDCHICAINKIIIEDGVLIASKVFITDHFHGEINSEAIAIPPQDRKLFSKGPVIIKKNVWIGEGVIILPNVTVGENSIIGANSVITKDIPNNSIVAGNPFKVIRTL